MVRPRLNSLIRRSGARRSIRLGVLALVIVLPFIASTRAADSVAPVDVLVGAAQVPLASIARAQFEVPEQPVWRGEVFPLRLSVEVDRDYFYNLNGPLSWLQGTLTTDE